MSQYVKSISRMMRRILNTLDYRLMDHGDTIAYLVLEMAKNDPFFNDEDISKISYLAMFHDIGAYETEDLDSLCDSTNYFQFELQGFIPHSVYSYIFFSAYDSFKDYADALLYHHFPYQKLLTSDCKNIKLASKLFIAEKIELFLGMGIAENATKILELLNNPAVSKEDFEILKKLEEEDELITKVINGTFRDDLMDYLAKNESKAFLESLVHMVPHAIDFKSEYTVTHTVATVEISLMLAKLSGLSETEIQEVYFGALLHDIGKVSISQLVLEKDSSLSDNEYHYMQDHVILSKHILKDCVCDNVLKIAIRHHEKLNGKGYPEGLKFEDLTLSQRIVAVADVMSALLGKRSYKDPFPPEKVKAILTNIKEKEELCMKCIDLAIENFDSIDKKVKETSEAAVKRYEDIQALAQSLKAKCEASFA